MQNGGGTLVHYVGAFQSDTQNPKQKQSKVNLKCISQPVLSINKWSSGKLKKINGTDTVDIQDHAWLRDFSPRFLTTLGY